MNKNIFKYVGGILSALFIFVLSAYSQPRVGDPGVVFDESKFDDKNYPQMREWKKAGVIGGIPFISDTPLRKTIDATNSAGLNTAINDVASQGGGQLKLNDGIYTIDEIVHMKSNVRVVGQSRDGVRLNVTMLSTDDSAIKFIDTQNAGIDNLTIEGGYGVPNDFLMENVKPEFTVTGVNMDRDTKNCWLDAVTIINIGNSAVSTWRAENITFRDLYVERSWNKGGGGRGYFSIQGSYTLVYNCIVKKLRHFVLQREGCFYNVVYQNYIDQDINFHNHDMGNNLIEQNVIRIQPELKSEYHAIMGPWSVQHAPSEKDNYAYRNDCIEYNNDGAVTFSDPNKVYLGARDYEKSDVAWVSNNLVPSGATFYPELARRDNTITGIPSTNVANIFEPKVHPNPFGSEIYISHHKGFDSAELMDISGRIVAKTHLDELNETEVFPFLGSDKAGIYFLRVIGKKGILTYKLLKK